MEQKIYRSLKKCLAKHLRIMFTGIMRTAFGAVVVGAISVAVYLLSNLPASGGYVAVLKFMFAAVLLIESVAAIYRCGGRARKKGGNGK